MNPNVKSWRDATGPIDYPLTNDLMFHLLLQDHEDILQSLISSMLHIPLADIFSTHIENPIAIGDYINNKMIVLDIKVTLNDSSIIDLEMQVANEGNWTDRSLAYLCRNFDNVTRGADYTSASPVTHIGFLDFELFPNFPEFYATYKLTNVANGNIFNDKFTLSVLSLNQIELATEEDKLWQIDKWAKAFKAKTWEELKMAATTTTLEKVADSIFVQNTDEQIRYAMFKKEEAEIHEARLRREREQLEAECIQLQFERTQLQNERSQLQSERSQLQSERSQLQNELNAAEAEILALRNQLSELQKSLH